MKFQRNGAIRVRVQDVFLNRKTDIGVSNAVDILADGICCSSEIVQNLNSRSCIYNGVSQSGHLEDVKITESWSSTSAIMHRTLPLFS